MASKGTILITGASGFLGSWIAKTASQEGYELLGVDIAAPQQPELFAAFTNNPCDRADFLQLVGDRKLRAVIHLAGSASVPQSVENPLGDFSSLLPGTVALLAYLTKHRNDSHLLLFSSAAVYGNPVQLPVTEAAAVAPISPYGIHKATAEFLIGKYAQLFGFSFSALRIFSAYGEGLRKQVVWDIGQKILNAIVREQASISMHGTGAETRDFIHARDIARAALLVIQNPPVDSQIINVASGVETSIRAVAELIAANLGCDIALDFNGATRAGDPVNWKADISRLNRLGFTPEICLEEGILRSLQWQRSMQAS